MIWRRDCLSIQLLVETEELIKIFFVSIRTASKKVVREGSAPYGDNP